jgi:cyclophilin family peptidyl-prolyl cis-trans isomerase
MGKVFVLILVTFGMLARGAVVGCCEEGSVSPKEPDEVGILHTSMGRIVVDFFADVAPNHVKNFKKLAREKFYDGTTFHRVIPGFMIQGGDPNTKDDDPNNDGSGGPGYRLKAEFNDRPHVRGTLSMARSADPDSAGSQFFICVARAEHLNGKYTAFGRAIEGMDVADKIVKVPRNEKDRPLEKVVLKSVRILSRPEWEKQKEKISPSAEEKRAK